MSPSVGILVTNYKAWPVTEQTVLAALQHGGEAIRLVLKQAGFTAAKAWTLECGFVSWVTITNLCIPNVLGYKITKPLFLLLNVLGWLLRGSRHVNLTLTVDATAVKP